VEAVWTVIGGVGVGKIVDVLKTGRILVSDGAWGTFLFEKGLKPGECPDEWSLTRSVDVQGIAQSYIDAGADMVETNSFGASSYKLQHFGLQDRASEINEAAARASRSAAGNKFVIASVGPTGKLFVTDKNLTKESLYEAFREQVIALEKGGADAVCVETMIDVDEACCAIKAAKENSKLEVIATFTFDRTAKGAYRTMMGISPAAAIKAVLDAGADIGGTNCGNGIERMIDIVREMKSARPDAYILVHANAGMPSNVDGKDVFPETPEMMERQVENLIDAGANIIGGCCGTTPAHIAAIREAVDAHNKKNGK
jgi:5-methyltetrahydrofolate--homocysteine methyltransferase